MQIKIDPTADVPPYIQLQSELEYFIVTGMLAPGSRLPSIRALARDSGLSLMTVMKSMHRLRQKGLVRIQPGMGAFVVDSEDGHVDVEHTVANVLRHALRRGVSRDELSRIFFDTLSEHVPQEAQRSIVLIGPQRGGLFERARVLESSLGDLHATVIPIALEALEVDPDGILEQLDSAEIFATLLFDIAAVRNLLVPRGKAVLPLMGRVRDEVRSQLAALPSDARIAIAASSREFLNGMMIAVEEFRSLSQEPICASTEDLVSVRRAVKSADAVVYGSLAKDKILAVVPHGVPAIELLYDVEPRSIARIREALSSVSERELVASTTRGA
jgi:GntR family transcriptional regulator